MTREEASNILDNFDVNFEGHTAEEVAEAFDVAFKALEQQPCEDAVSRQAVLDGLASIAKVKARSDAQKSLMGRVMFFVEQSPSVTPKEKTGKWIKTQSGDDMFPEIIVCSKCNNENSHLDFNEHAEPIGKVFIKSKFCPNCGAKMVEPQESEVSE